MGLFKGSRHVTIFFGLIFFVFSALWLFPAQSGGQEKAFLRGEQIRASILAGTWYPGSRESLTETIQELSAKLDPPRLDGALKAIIVPHAGYRYSGRVAAHAYQLLKGKPFKRVILIGPSHRVRFDGVSVNLQAGYETPLGIVPVDQVLAGQILKANPNIRWRREAHAREHSLEIQLPFLQTFLGKFQIVPIVMGRQDLETCSSLSKTLAQVLGNADDTLLLASSDLSHYHPYNRAKALDLQFIKRVQMFDPHGLAKDLSMGMCEGCGGGPVITVLMAAKEMGARRAVILNHANSGDVTGDHSRVVGYLSAALVK